MNKLVAFWDIDGTIVTESMERHFIRFLRQREGSIAFLSRLVGNVIVLTLKKFVPKWRDIKLAYLREKHKEDVERLAEECWKENIAPAVYDGARRTIKHLRENGVRQVLLSGTLSLLSKFPAEEFEVEGAIAAEPEYKNSRLSGRLTGEHPHGEYKMYSAKKWLEENNLSWNDAVAFANSWEDRFLLEKVKYPVVVNPDSRLREKAVSDGWPIVNGGNYFETYMEVLKLNGVLKG